MAAADSRSRSGRFTLVIVLALTLAVFGAVVAFVTLRLRVGLREQVLAREAEALAAVASLQLANESEALPELGVSDAPGQLLAAVLKTSKLRGVFAIRVFDSDRHFVGAVPAAWSETPPPPEDWAMLLAGTPFARLHERERPSNVAILIDATDAARAPEPLLEVWTPVRRLETGPLAGAAQFWIYGRSVAAEFDALDRSLLFQATIAWFAGAIMITWLVGWAFRRLAVANRELERRTDDLQRANAELTLAAKTSALGAVTAHLMHELKNPVAGLEEFVASQTELAAGENGGELAAASELTRRLRTMINDVVSVLRDEQSSVHFELTPAELVELAVARNHSLAERRGVSIETRIEVTDVLSARRANLTALVVQNLLQNAIEATPAERSVRVIAKRHNSTATAFLVEDRGPGLPAAVRARLFQPCVSTKPGGSGLGLALSQQLARQAGGRIELIRSDAGGTCFGLVLEPEQ
jgi:signal transduction histidine kinase